jgi:hypothetical protein
MQKDDSYSVSEGSNTQEFVKLHHIGDYVSSLP